MRRTSAILVVLLLPAGVAISAPAQEGDAYLEAPRGMTNPLAYTATSINAGRKHYLRLCQNCHGADGRALDNFDYEASDLTEPKRWIHGSSDGETFVSIKEGAGLDMPAFEDKLDDEQVWQTVNFLHSIGPSSSRPELVAED